MIRILAAVLALVALTSLSACESSEERAERHYQSALQLIEEGDDDRAMVELRNVFKYNGFHREARQLYADKLVERGNMQEAYSQYLRLVEQYPDAVEARVVLAEMAFDAQNWEEVERHGGAAIELAPDLPEVKAVDAALTYRRGVLDEEPELRAEALEESRAVLEVEPENPLARQIVIDTLLTGENPVAALPEVELALETDPQNLRLLDLRFRLLVTDDRLDEAEDQLEQMFELAPDNEAVQQTLTSWYASRGDLEGAEALLRQLAGADDADPAGHLVVVQFLRTTAGPEAAEAELDRLTEANAGTPNADVYRSLRAGLMFDRGDRDAAIAELQSIVDAAEPSDQTRQIQTTLARMLNATGNTVGARALVEEVLNADPSNVEGLKLRAAWAIMEDRPVDAINDLRAALAQSPRDADIMTLMAEAHERDGNLDLAGERLAAAVEASNRAPAESLRYARFLTSQDRAEAARSVLVEARRMAPDNLDLLRASAELAVQMQDWTTAGEVADLLAAIDGDEAAALARDLEAAQMLRQNRTGEIIDMIQGQEPGSGTDGVRSASMLVLARLQEGDLEGAREALDTARADNPDEIELALLSANLRLAENDPEAAEAELRALLESDPGELRVITSLHTLLTSLGRTDEAAELLDAALQAQPGAGLLQVMKATELEQAGDIDGAIAIYEDLYAASSSNMIVANNLASLLASHRDDAESLERAEAIARRLRGRDVPAFQDTYGWIAYRRGDLEAALESLEPAAEGLPDDPLVQYHLGMTYLGLERTEEARAALTRAVEAAGDRDLPQIEEARARLEELPPAE